MRRIAILGLLTLLAMFAMPTASAHVEIYFDPQDSSVPGGYDNITYVKVMANITGGDALQAGQMGIYHNESCANITNLEWGPNIFQSMSKWNEDADCYGTNMDWIAYMFGSTQTGVVEICNLTIQCNCSDCGYCKTPLNWSCGRLCGACPIQVLDSGYNQIYPRTLVNGSVECGTPSTEVDLNVTDIDVNPSCNIGHDEIFVNQSNQINATVYNAGPGNVVGTIDVCFYDDAKTPRYYIGSTTVSGLLAGESKPVSIYWTPDCADYPAQTAYPALGIIPVTLNATVDCNDVVGETDETNNTLLLDTEVSVNGYKSKNFDCDPSEPLELFNGYNGTQFHGGLAYNVSGVKAYPFAPGGNQTRIHHINLPLGVAVKEARLYITWYDYWGNSPPGCLANLSVNLTGPGGSETFTTPDAMYTDQKAYDGSDSPKGKYAYNVTSWVCNNTSSDYSVTVENIDPTNSTTLLGGILVVVYEGGDEHIGLWWLEGCDLLSGRTKYCSSTTEATATVAFPGNIPLAIVNSTELITFVDQGQELGANMLFNGINVMTDAWNKSTDSKINVETYDVPTSDLLASGNTMGFQDTGTMGMQADLAFLVVTKSDKAQIGIDQPEFVDPQSQFTINITVDPQGNEISAVQYDLYYNTSVVWAEWANPGPFLKQNGATTDVTVLSIDNLWDVEGHTGKISYAETTYDYDTGILPSVNTPGNITTIHFSAIGVRNASNNFNFSDVLMSNLGKDPVDYDTNNCTVTIYNNKDPVANASSKYWVSNVASKFQCFAAVCCCNSNGGDDLPGWGENITYIRWDFGDGEYGTSEGLEDCQKHHEYTTWNWNGTGYDPFIAYLTVRDDGEPQLSNTTQVEVVVYIAGDTNGDGVVDIFDAACVGKHWGQDATNNPPKNCTRYWDDNKQGDEADLNNDNHVNTIDAMIVGTNWNHLAYAPYIKE